MPLGIGTPGGMPIGGIPIGGMPIGGMPGMPMGGMPIIIGGMPIIIGGMLIFGPVIARPLAIDMNFAEGFRYPDKSHRNAMAC
mmetsp:Transcript_22498/g.63883  ORF Transcript_22498/g.63883 Transcript_22498/m.63883 type:complete len:83 (-) Transcript_22498:598-846(-)